MENEIQRPQDEQELKIGIIGLGFVGKAVSTGFSGPRCNKMIIDPKYNNNTLKDLYDFKPQVTFICLPTPSKDDGSIDATEVEKAVKGLIAGTQSFIVIKSTCTPDVIKSLTKLDSRIVFEPEFLTEANAIGEFMKPGLNVIGITEPNAAQYLDGLYKMFSRCHRSQAIQMSPIEAATFKYACNTFLAMKIIFANQLKAVVDSYGGDYNILSKLLPADQRLGPSHWMVPGLDDKEGFGGACFPKDLNAWIHFAEEHGGDKGNPTLLKQVAFINNQIRKEYELSDREKEQNVNYGQAKEELKDKSNGSSKQK
jgi:UDPglucose 6-dehydrogenase